MPVLIEVNHERPKTKEPLVLITKAMNIYSGEIDEFINFVNDSLSEIDFGIIVNAASYSHLGPFFGQEN